MLVNLKREGRVPSEASKAQGAPEAPGTDNLPDPARLLRDCHERIRRFSALAVRLADPDVAEGEAREAAAAVHRYFTVALPLHVKDEDQSLAPLLEAHGAGDDVREALATMSRQHAPIEAAIERLAVAWARIAEGRATPAERRATSNEAARLEAQLADHLASEERTILPAIDRLLPAAARQALAEAMRARRA